MRELNEHMVNHVNDQIRIVINDAPGPGGANHRYELSGFDTATNPSNADPEGYVTSYDKQVILFQNGTIPDSGVNGITAEALLAIVADRLRSFQKGSFSCKENACALTHVEEALHWLHARTLARLRRGVEGTHTI